MSTYRQDIQSSLDGLQRETKSSKELRDAVETLIKINRNALPDSAPDSVRRIRIGNSTFHNAVWRYDNARKILLMSGWAQEEYTVEHGAAIYLKNKDNTRELINILLDYRSVPPRDEEWDHRSKIEQLKTKEEAQKEEDERRRKALEESKKIRQQVTAVVVDDYITLVLFQMLEDKAYREELARTIKAEHEAERKAREARIPKTDQQIKEEEYAKKSHPVHNPPASPPPPSGHD